MLPEFVKLAQAGLRRSHWQDNHDDALIATLDFMTIMKFCVWAGIHVVFTFGVEAGIIYYTRAWLKDHAWLWLTDCWNTDPQP